MKIKSSALALSAGLITAAGFGICGVLFAVAPAPTAAFFSWALHTDFTAMTRPVSVLNLCVGIVLVGAYVGSTVGITGALYNKFTVPATR